MPCYTLQGLDGEKQVQERVERYKSFPNEQLLQIIQQYGGEMAQAAQIVLQGRGVAAPASASGGGPLISIPTPQVTIAPTAAAAGGALTGAIQGLPSWVIPMALAAGAFFLTSMFTGRR